MKVVFLSNYYNHHQAPFSEAMYAQTNGKYIFVETSEVSQWRLSLGYGMSSVPAFVKKYGMDHATDTELRRQIDTADVVIIGSAPQSLIANRLRKGKLTFEYSERIYKTGLTPYKWVRQMAGRILRNQRYRGTYMLCASAYTAADYAKIFAYIGKTCKWGYFPAVKHYDDIDRLLELKRPASILWVARLIEWKHPEAPLLIAQKLKAEGYSFSLDLIGNGALEEQIKNQIQKCGLEDCVHLLGAMKPDQVREHMEQSEIFFFTSDFNEGWGAVLNESMNSGCAVVASHAIGSVPFLIEDEKNGMIYENGNIDDLYRKVKYLLDHPEEQRRMGKAAYETITGMWSAEVAAERFLQLAQKILDGDKSPDLFESGPCSRAKSLENSWYHT